MRSGFIISISKTAGIGLIRDSNNQKIRFHVEDTNGVPNKGDLVTFEISFKNWSLAATNVMVLHPPKESAQDALI
ncbi:hypothetical protein EV200_101652 [Pedobacter psychrotolerans]|uniref:Cold shock CspA family protein n=1 Tax=Pedobacter psychrotolerans TaxID=1843235 RepID=A0A4R2HP87_9SPHI|nr:hypothetical protein [Pedobacter psychrotolerans]TCO31204.1 hypothetical protein EV200_101652 [Pedobacter psychrotolerans]GGE41431.1 hypothetical protein GCM10011413_04140 [Pedobacter psychrotolerans]